MKRLSRSAASRLSHAAATVILACGAIPIALPLCWLVLSSLKTADRVLTERPEWLPVDDGYTIEDDEANWRVTVLDRSRGSALGWWRVRPTSAEDASYFLWPAAKIERAAVKGYVAPIGPLKRAVTAPQPTATPGQVVVGQRGTQLIEPVEPADVRSEAMIEEVLDLLGQEVPVAAETRALPDTEPRLCVGRAGVPFHVAESRIVGSPAEPRIRLDDPPGCELPIEVLARWPAAGVCQVRFPAGAPIPAEMTRSRIERRQVTRHFLRRDVGDVEVRPVRWNASEQPIEVAIVGEPRQWVQPAGSITTVVREELRIRWLDQVLTVVPRADVAAPPGLVALQTTAPHDAALVAADRVRHEQRIAPQWSNYVNVFRVEPLYRHVLNTLFITALCIVGNVLSCGVVGYAFARLQFRGRDALFVVVLATLMLPATITFLPTYILYTKIGWLDSFYPLIVPAFLATSAFFIFLYRQFFLTIPLDLEDAARIDGCGPLGTFWHIMLPLARPAVVTVAVFTFLGTWNDFMGPLLYLNTDEYQTLAYGLYAFKAGFGYKFPNYMMAASLMMMIPTLVVFFVAQAAFIRGVVVTGVKG